MDPINIYANIPQDLTIIALSDTHNRHRELVIPDGDILIHAGDFTIMSRSLDEIEDFGDWLCSLPHRHKILVPGNHEYYLEADPKRSRLFPGVHTLINRGIEVEGLHIWGSPTTPLYGGAFGVSSPTARRQIYDSIPRDVDILVTHGPPSGILDLDRHSGEHLGCNVLREAVQRVKPKLCLFGHIHGGRGFRSRGSTTFVNCSIVQINEARRSTRIELRATNACS